MSREAHNKKTHAKFLEELAEKRPDVECIGTYINKRTKVRVKHDCGYVWDVLPQNVLKNASCIKCRSKNHRLSHDQFVARLKTVHDDVICLDQYVDSNTKLRFKHLSCGCIWYGNTHDVLGGSRCPECYGTQLKSHEAFIKELKQERPDIECLGKYVGQNTKILFRHDCGYEWNTTPKNVLKCSSCPRCAPNHNKSHDNFVAELAEKRPDITIRGQYVNGKTAVEFEHTCGYVWSTTPAYVLDLATCPKCHGAKSHDAFIAELADVRPDITCLGIYKRSNGRILFKHDCGHEWITKPLTVLNSISCPKCSGRTKLTHAEFIEKLALKRPELTCLDTYSGSKVKLKVKHTCGYVWELTPDHMYNGVQCPNCSDGTSKGERTTMNLLMEMGLMFETQKTFEECKNINMLPFDFYLPEHNLCIEYQGLQHFKPIEHWGGEREFKLRKRRDNIKRQYCKDNNIQLLEIRYDEDVLERLESILNTI